MNLKFLALSLVVFNVFAANGESAKVKLTGSDVKLISELDKLSDIRVYSSKNIKAKYKNIIEDQTDINETISTANKKEEIKKVIKTTIKGKILAVKNNVYNDNIERLNVSFDKGCTNLADECSYTFMRNYNKDVFNLIQIPKNLSINDELKKEFNLSSDNVRRNVVLEVIKSEIEEVKTDTVQSQGW